MFDDQPVNNSSMPPANLPVAEPPDMFAGVENNETTAINSEPAMPVAPDALSAGILKKKDNPSPSLVANSLPPMSTDNSFASDAAVSPAMYNMKEPILGKILIALLLMLVVVGLAWGGSWLYANVYHRSTPTGVNGALLSETPQVAESVTIPPEAVAIPTSTDNVVVPGVAGATVNMANDEILFGEPIDSDQDGLDDARETDLGTDINNKDTDSDGLTDGDEVTIWKTDPLNPDTDGDTHPDGTEVNFGYNPLGPGKLFDVSTATAE